MPKKQKPLTRQQISDSDIKNWQEGGVPYEIMRDGKRYAVTPGGLVPITGPQAQKRLKKKRKPKTPENSQ